MTCFDTRVRTAAAHDALRQRIGDVQGCLDITPDDSPAAVWLHQIHREAGAWGRILALHAPDRDGLCEECGYTHPCLTVTLTLAAVLGPVEVTE